ncbi:TonB-dependent receptor [Sphingomonas sp. NFR15]|uniref:TonB-dependent receptor domain-containing protein n=1 Tax=Sphingomonas sp. NFR15 TaxID=1566282 RepID=UPI00088CC4E6|nr:TonB-dependent receptor [Sphingomonas sp. NFR15]SDA12560.1 Outer membrane receptor proteins, mostly Fe transport [Sphingomonas sp. NFR15]
MAVARIALIRAGLAALALTSASPALAARAPVLDLPAGRLADALAALGRQASVSVSVDDASLWQRRVPALRASVPVASALRRLLRDTGAEAVEVVPGVWRVRVAARPKPKPRPLPPRASPPAEATERTVIVVASKRDLRLRDYAGAVSVVDGADLTFGGAGGTDAVLSRLATVSSTYLGAGRNKLFIRGIADSSFTGPTQATVGQYLGDARLSYNAPDPDLRLYDIQSVEVLEGPQGTLYGAGSLGGIIRTVPNAPVLGATGGSILTGVSLTEHGAPSGDLAGALNLPIAGERAALRLVGYGVSDGGYIDNPLRHRDDINRTNIAGGRATLRIDLGGGWTTDLGGIVQDTHGDDSQYADAGGARLVRNSPVAEGFDTSYRLGQAVIAKESGALRFRATGAVIGQRLTERYDATPPGGDPRVFVQRNTTNLVTGEARVWQPLHDRFGWVIGASYLHNETRLDRAFNTPAGNPRAPLTGVDNRVSEMTLYGEASYRLTPWLTATAGGRISRTRLAGSATDAPVALTLVEAAERARIVSARDATRVLPSLALLATPLPDVALYAKYQEGFRPGGLAIDSGFVRRFRGDRVMTAEAGVRYGVAGRSPFDLALAVSHTDWRDIQADFLDNSGLPSTDNIGNGRIWSVAATLGWRPVPGLRLDASVAFNDGRVTEPSASYRALIALLTPGLTSTTGGPNATLVSGWIGPGGIDRIPNVARVTARLGIDWQHRLHDDLMLHLGGWGRYVGQSRIGVGPVLGAEQGDYADSAATLRIGTSAMGVTLGVTNIGDAIGNRFALGTPFATGRSQITPLRPRTVRLGFDLSF